MKNLSRVAFAGMIMLAPAPVLAAAPAPAPEPAPSKPAIAVDAAERGKIESVIRDLLDREPEIVLKAAKDAYGREEAKAQEKARQEISQNRDALVKSAHGSEAGNPKGDVTVVEFFDYQCGHCRSAHGTVAKLISEDSNVRVIYRHMPILGEASGWMAFAAIAAQQQGKFKQMHDAMMTVKSPQTKESLIKMAEGAGLDVAKFTKALDSSESKAALTQDVMLAKTLNINGTPAFIIGDQMFSGELPLEQFKSVIAEQRKKKS
ncbi:MAG: DsbA family protein [Alphaproteobacteria bacterium]|nr:MAG: DsbA family protein [Alphaproteobacteria bacterium]